jgi:prepilin-type N-terminal cleavage/methylation domain-containing protein
MTKRTRARDAGFTLVEAMVALVVFSIGILGLAALMPIGSRTVSSAGRQTRASELCSNAAENLLALPYDAPDLTSGTHDDPGNPFPGKYYVSWNVEDDQPVANSKRITVTVRWPTSTSTTLQRLVIVNPLVD